MQNANQIITKKVIKPPQNYCFEAIFGRSVIIGLGKIQSYQWFASRQQEVLIIFKLLLLKVGQRYLSSQGDSSRYLRG